MHFVKFPPEVASCLLPRGKRKYAPLGMRLIWKYIRNYFLEYQLISHFLSYLQNYKEFNAKILDLQPKKYGLSFHIKKCTTSGWALGDENVIGKRAFKVLGTENTEYSTCDFPWSAVAHLQNWTNPSLNSGLIKIHWSMVIRPVCCLIYMKPSNCLIGFLLGFYLNLIDFMHKTSNYLQVKGKDFSPSNWDFFLVNAWWISTYSNGYTQKKRSPHSRTGGGALIYQSDVQVLPSTSDRGLSATGATKKIGGISVTDQRLWGLSVRVQ